MRKIAVSVLLCSTLLQPFQAVAEGTEGTSTPPAQAGTPSVSNSDSGTPAEQPVQQLSGWVEEAGVWYYYVDNIKVKGWKEIDGAWFYLDLETGARQHGWIQVDNQWFYLDEVSGARQYGWIQSEDSWFYLKPQTGEKLFGWLQIDSEQFYLDPETGARQTGWLQLENKWYYFDPAKGVAQKGWIEIEGKSYYLDPETGERKTGWVTIDNQQYFLNEEGVKETGWVYSNDNWYYFGSDGTMQTGWVYDQQKWYFLNNSGIMQTGWVFDQQKWYYLKSNGAMQTGWIFDENKWYYLGSGGAMQRGWLWWNNKWYFLNSDGSMKKGWHWENKKWYYLLSDGTMAKGWYVADSKWYYANSSGVMLTNTTINGFYVGYLGFWIPDIVNPRKVYTYDEMVSDISLLKQYYPDLVTTQIIGKSVDGRNLYAIKIGKGQKEIFLNGSHHAREHMTTNLLMEMMDQYIHSYVNGTSLSGYNVRDLLNKTSMWFVPMVNPDGVTLVQKGAWSAKNPNYLLLLNNNNPDFSSWKANIRGVDLNRQYPANWANIRSNPGKPASQNFKGYQPLSEPEVIAVYNFTKAHNFKTAVAYHSAGEILYWNFKQSGANYTRDYNLALKYSNLTGYTLVKPEADPSGGGYTDWFIQDIKNPGFTPEISPSTNGKPVPVSYFDRIWNQNKAAGLMLATEALTR